MRPKLSADTLYLPVAEGVYLHNNCSTLTMKGKTTYRWLETLVPYFDGRHSLEELTDGLDESRKVTVANLVETLFAHHFLRDVSQDQSHGLSEEDLDTYASEIAFIESFQPSAAHRFEMFRQTRLLVIGSGISFSALARSCLHSGIKNLSVIRTVEEQPIPDVYSALDDSQHYLSRDTSQCIVEYPAPCWDNEAEILATLQPFDAVLHISDRPMLERARLLNVACTVQHKLLLQACFVDNQAWVGPLVNSEVEGCWECAWRRLQSNLEEQAKRPLYAFQNQGEVLPGRRFAFPAAAMAANQLVFELFKAVTQAGPVETADHMISLNLETLASSSHAFLPHPLCQTCQHPSALTETAFLEQIRHMENQKPIDETSFSKQAALCFNQQLGLFRSIDEGHFEQVPLAVCQVEVSDPLALQDQSQTQSVVAVGTSFKDARHRCTQQACEVYASRLADPRRFISHREATHPVIPPESFVTPFSPTSVELWSWASNLHTRSACLVPASLVFPALCPSEDAEAERGIGSGVSWSEAICQALLDWARHLTIAQINDVQHPYPRVDLKGVPLSPQGKHLLAMLTTVGERPEIYDITGPLGVPTFAIHAGEAQTLAYCSHYDTCMALNMGLERALQRYQSHYAQQPEYDLAPVPLLANSLRSSQRAVWQPPAAPQGWTEGQIWLLQRFQENGWHALAVPLDHDPALTRALPFLVKVLLIRVGDEKEGTLL